MLTPDNNNWHTKAEDEFWLPILIKHARATITLIDDSQYNINQAGRRLLRLLFIVHIFVLFFGFHLFYFLLLALITILAKLGIRGIHVSTQFSIAQALIACIGLIPHPRVWSFDSVNYLEEKHYIDLLSRDKQSNGFFFFLSFFFFLKDWLLYCIKTLLLTQPLTIFVNDYKNMMEKKFEFWISDQD